MPRLVESRRHKSISAIDLFCGAGGLTRGLLDAGLKVVAGVDVDKACQFPFEFNNEGARFVHRDLTDVESKEVAGLFHSERYRVLVGCAPCQPFSTYSRQYRRHSKDKRWSLLRSFSRIAIAVRPDVISMENVTQIMQHDAYFEFVDALQSAGYWVSDPHVVFGPDYGLPQDRKRVIVFASLHGQIDVVPPTHSPCNYVTLAQAIGDLEPIIAGGASPRDRLHKSSSLSKVNLDRIKTSRPGGTWREWPRKLRLKCHKRPSGATYPSVYGRMEWDRPSPTLTTQFYGFGNGRFGHPEQHRALSLREGAILQGFPRDYQFVPPDEEVSFRNVGRMIGNAVPVALGKLVGLAIKQHLLK